MTQRSRVPLLVTLLFGAAAIPAVAQTDWACGRATTDITPQVPVRLAGYASRSEPFREVLLPLQAKALFLRHSAESQALLITTDLLGLSATLAESVAGRIMQGTGLRRDQILINSSHTHTGPSLVQDSESPEWPADQVTASKRYTAGLQDKLVLLAARAVADTQPARLSHGTGVATFVMNRREATERGIRLGVNPSGLADRSVPVLKVETADGRPLAILFGTACHNTTLSGKHLHISGDFAGYAQQHVERELNGVQAMFLQGCAGDANPFPRGEEAIARHHGSTLGTEVLRVLAGDLVPVRGPVRTVMTPVRLPLQPAPSSDELQRPERSGGWSRWVAGQMREQLKNGALQTHFETPVAVWQFGDDLTLVALPGEVVVGYVRLLEQALGPRKLWISAYCNDVFGYLPTAEVLEQGGYETRGLYSGGVGFFAPEAERVMVDHVRSLARQAGRDE